MMITLLIFSNHGITFITRLRSWVLVFASRIVIKRIGRPIPMAYTTNVTIPARNPPDVSA